MALNIPMPDLSGNALLKGLDTGSSMFSRMIQPVIERERLKQQQNQFVQEYALKQQAQQKANSLLPYRIQQYQDMHKTAASEAQMKELYRGLIQDALKESPSDTAPSATGGGSGMGGGGMPPQLRGTPSPSQGLPDENTGQPSTVAPVSASPDMPQDATEGEHELRPGNPRLARLDAVAGLVPGIPKPIQHFANGIMFTTYPSGRMTAQSVNLPGVKTPAEKQISEKEASKIRDQASALANSANLVQQGYDLLSANPNLTGPGNFISALPIPFTGGAKINLSNKPELGKFTTVTGKLQAELGKYAASRGGIQAVKWAGSVKPNQFNPEGYNYGMFEGIQQNLQDDYNTLNAQYKAATGKNLPVALPAMKSPRGAKVTTAESGKGKVTKWKMKDGQLVKE